jgi:hypothetical protein
MIHLADQMTLSYNVIMSTTPRRSRVFSISLPPEMAASAEYLARRENRTMSELFREAFRAYHAQKIGAIFDEIGKYAATRNPHGYTEDDVDRLVHEVREEMRAEAATRSALVSK